MQFPKGNVAVTSDYYLGRARPLAVQLYLTIAETLSLALASSSGGEQEFCSRDR